MKDGELLLPRRVGLICSFNILLIEIKFKNTRGISNNFTEIKLKQDLKTLADTKKGLFLYCLKISFCYLDEHFN